jgi:uncharacterized protein (TIGR03083 family)
MSYLDFVGTDFVGALRDENARFAEAAERSGGTAPVATCPGWSIDDLVFHMVKVQNMFHGMISTPSAQSPKDLPRIERASNSADLLGQFHAGAQRLENLLAGLDDGDAVWTFTGGDIALWVKRRQAQEALVHRFDAESASGDVSHADAALCADGVDELLHVFLPLRFDTEKYPMVGSVHLHCTDTDGEWMIAPSSSGVVVSREHAKGDVALRGPAQLLLRVMWHRISVDDAMAGGAEVFGSRAALDALLGGLVV